jgi:hypothetical protein
MRWGLVFLAAGLPVVWLSPGCGSRSDLDGLGGSGGVGGSGGMGGADGGPDAPPDVQPDVTFDAPPDVPFDVPLDVPQDVPLDVPADVPLDVPIDVPMDVPQDVPIDVPLDVPMDVPQDVPIDVQPDGPCPDSDHDGWTTCDGDCNDEDPKVNPGAYDFPNGVDDDCDGVVDDPITDCSAGLQYTSQNPFDYAKAIDICQTTTANATGAAKRWGLINAELRLADGTGTPAAQSHSIVTSFGNVIGPRKNANFAYLSTGIAATPSQPYYQGGTPQPGTSMLPPGPVDNGGYALPVGFPTNKAGCMVPSAAAYDPVNLKLTIRVPTNASSVAFDHAFWSAEYPEYACTGYNDIWAVLLDSKASGIANNHDVVFDAQGTPGSVNLNFFDRCVAGPTGCSGGLAGFNFCSGGSAELAGTGYGDPDSPCNVASSVGGGTGWLTTESPVVPGETIVIQFMVWDSSDPIYDSTAILDNFRWQQGSLTNPKTHR